MPMARNLLGYWQPGISWSQLETGAAGTAHFEPGGVAFWDDKLKRESRRRAEARWRLPCVTHPLYRTAAVTVGARPCVASGVNAGSVSLVLCWVRYQARTG